MAFNGQKFAAPLAKLLSSKGKEASVAPKGHFAVYSREGRRFVVPITYLKSSVFKELFRMSEEEYGLPAGDSPIRLPCDASFMEHVVASLKADAEDAAHATMKGWTRPCSARSIFASRVRL